MNRYMILVRETKGQAWRDCQEGPFDSYADALTFAQAEIGFEWRIVRIMGKVCD